MHNEKEWNREAEQWAHICYTFRRENNVTTIRPTNMNTIITPCKAKTASNKILPVHILRQIVPRRGLSWPYQVTRGHWIRIIVTRGRDTESVSTRRVEHETYADMSFENGLLYVRHHYSKREKCNIIFCLPAVFFHLESGKILTRYLCSAAAMYYPQKRKQWVEMKCQSFVNGIADGQFLVFTACMSSLYCDYVLWKCMHYRMHYTRWV